MADNSIRRFVRAIFDRESARKVEQQLGSSLASAGKQGGENFLREIRSVFNKRMADLRVQLAKGIINPAEFRKQSDLAAKEFNTGLVKGMEEARRQGKLTEAEYVKLAKQIKNTGDVGVTAWDRMKRSITSAGQALAVAFGARAITRWIDGSIDKFADFDLAMTQSLSIMSDIDDAMRGKMSDAAKQVGEEFNFAASEVAKAFFYLASAGLDAEQSLAALPNVARFAKAGAFDLATATDLLTDAQSALGMTIRDDVVKNMENMSRVSDVLVKANVLANATVEQFSESLTNKAGAALRLVNKDVEEGVAVLAAYADQGTKGAEAGETLNITLRELQKAARDNKKEFDKFGISVFDGNGKIRNMADIVADLERVLGPMSDRLKGATLAQLGFTEKSINGLKSLLGYSDAIRNYETQLRSAAGTTQSVADKQMQAFAEKWGQVKQQLTNARIALGEAIIKALDLAKNLPRITALIGAFANHVEDLVGFVGSLTKALVIVAGLRGLLALRAGFIAAESGMALFRLGLTRLYVAIGPTGWAIIGLTLLMESFRGVGKAAEDAAQKATDAVADLKQSLGEMDSANIEAKKTALEAQRVKAQKAVDALTDIANLQDPLTKAGDLLFGGGVTENLEVAREELGGIVDQMNILRREANRRTAEAKKPKPKPKTGTGNPEDGTNTGGDSKANDAFKERHDALQQEIADLKVLRDAQAQGADVTDRVKDQLKDEADLRTQLKDLTPAQAAAITTLVTARNAERDAITELAQAEKDRADEKATYDLLERQDEAEKIRQRGILAKMGADGELDRRKQEAERAGVEAVKALNRELYIQEALYRSNAISGSAFADQVAAMAAANWDAANNFATPWIDAMGLLRNEVEGQGTLFKELGQAWADGGIAGVAALAKAKVKENVAAAIENAARALSSLALGSPKSATEFALSSAKHVAAAAAWGVAGASAGSGGTGGSGGGSIANSTAGQNSEPAGPEVNIYLDGPGFDALNPTVQKVVYGAQQEARERYGENAKVNIVRRK